MLNFVQFGDAEIIFFCLFCKVPNKGYIFNRYSFKVNLHCVAHFKYEQINNKLNTSSCCSNDRTRLRAHTIIINILNLPVCYEY